MYVLCLSVCTVQISVGSSMSQNNSCIDYTAAVRYKIVMQKGCETKHLGLFECGWERCVAKTTKNVTGRVRIWCL
jgi:hypothetical protein